MGRRKKSNLKKILLISFILLILFCASAFAYGYMMLDRLSSRDIPAKETDLSKPVNILLLGVDAGDYENKTQNNPQRSDTIMLIRYDPGDNKAYMLSIPRDTRVQINGQVEKINSANRIGGTALAVETIENLLGVKINYYAKIDYSGFRQCVDAIGGLDVVIPCNMDYDAYGISIHFKKGEKVHLDGEKAEEFVRWRKNNDGAGYAMGDLGRISTQQDFLVKIAEKLKTPAGVIRIPALLDTSSKYISTNMSPKTILKYLLRIRDVNTNSIEKEMLAGEPKYIHGISFYVWNKEKSADFLENFKNASSSGITDNVEKSDINVMILNSTGVKGLAAKYQTELKALGYNVVNIGNYSTKLDKTEINDYSQKDYGSIICSDIEFGEVVKKENMGSGANIVVILGADSVK